MKNKYNNKNIFVSIAIIAIIISYVFLLIEREKKIITAV